MSETEWSIVASAVSISLAVFAIALSLVFFRWSSKASDSTNRAADLIKQSVEQLRGETFSTLTTTLDRVLPVRDEEEASRRFAEQVEAITKDYEERFSVVVQRLKIADDTASELRAELRQAVGGAIEESRKIEDTERQLDLRGAVLFLMRPGSRYVREFFANGLTSRGYRSGEVDQAIDDPIAERVIHSFDAEGLSSITRSLR